ncbi:hypothetical protein NW768_010903 [Fusarium equiseti]|uniref:Protein kinase domain-containing protein n=1 Tax=Fusarium equiseti TaxID=61235 RepID=A0ABQ8QZ44_FUSEQ|nr:hypothetical protein NW768_010903 [Fusarium equiseti]
MELPSLFLNPRSILGNNKVWMAFGDDLVTFNNYRPNVESHLRHSGIPECSEQVFIALYKIGKSRDEAKTVVVVSCTNHRIRKLTKEGLRSCPHFQEGGALARFKIIGKATPPETTHEPVPTMQGDGEPNELSNSSSEELDLHTQSFRHTSGGHQFGVFLSRDRSASGKDYLGRRVLARQQSEQGASISQSATAGPLILVDGRSYQLTVQHVANFNHLNAQGSCHITDDWDDEDDEELEGRYSSDEEVASWNAPASLSGSGESPYTDMGEAVFSDSSSCNSFGRNTNLEGVENLQQHSHPLYRDLTANTPGPSGPRESHDATTQEGLSLVQSSALEEQSFLYGSAEIDYLLIPTDVGLETVSESAEVVQECGHFNVYDLMEARSVIIPTAVLGYVRGAMFPAPILSRRARSQSFQTLFCVQSEKIIPKGASGSAIFDERTGLLAGYIVLGCPLEGVWYMTPISTVLDDLRERLGVQARCQIYLDIAAVENLSQQAADETKQQSTLHNPLGRETTEPHSSFPGSLSLGSHNINIGTRVERNTSYSTRLETFEDANGEIAKSPTPMAITSLPLDVAHTTKEYFKYTGNGIVPILDTIGGLGRLLRTYCVTDGIDDKFLTDGLLRHILTIQRIRQELEKPKYKLRNSQVDEYVQNIHPSSENSSSTAYIKVFALLVLLDRVPDIEHFVSEQVDDRVLPIEIKNEHVYPVNDPQRRLRCFDAWKPSEQEYFEEYQWMVDTPFFHCSKDQPLTELTLHQRTRRPWRRIRNGSGMSDGAYGTVIQVEIHPTAHSYEQVLREINLDCTTFAIKTLHKIPANTERAYMQEWEMLKRFSGLNHPHLVTALGAFRQDDELSFIFPYAPFNFGYYIESSGPPQGWRGAIWASEQLAGLIGAIDTMHNPKHLIQDSQRIYARHGDIKCDNILCFPRSGTADEVNLVITDFGLSAFNSDKSRSNIPNRDVPPVPGYRPPECDVEGGTISRAFDIWTVGCLFLELATWFLGGPRYVEEFRHRRTTPFINGSMNDIFFTFENPKSGDADGTKAILVKPEVTTWIHHLRQHPDCSQFLHEVLTIIEQEMLVMTDKKRSSSERLRKAFLDISETCKSKENYTRGDPWTDQQLKAVQNDTVRRTTAVRVIPSKNAKALMSVNQMTMSVHHAQLTLSLSKDGRKSMKVKEISYSYQRASWRR